MDKDIIEQIDAAFSKFGQSDNTQPVAHFSNYDESDYRIDLSRFYPDVEYLLNVNGVGLFARGDIQAIKGKKKKGKSFFIVSVVAALLKGNFGILKAKMDDCKVLLVDTEQSKANVARNARKIHKLCGWSENEPNVRFNILSLRKYSIEDRKNIIEKEIVAFRPDLVMLDGIKDLCYDFLDNKESSDVVGMLMRLSEECETAICCVLHENKNDSNGRGHLGAELVNKCSEEYQITKDGDTINIKQTECRNAPLRGELSFTIDENGMPTEIVGQEFTIAKTPEKRSIWPMFFADKASYTRKELCEKIMEVKEIQSASAYAKIRDAIKTGELLIDSDENITLKPVVFF